MRRGLLGSLIFVSSLLGGAPLSAASFSLTSPEIQAAIRFGQRAIVNEEFDREWKLTSASGETLKVVTPFFRLVFWADLRGGREDFARWYQPVLVVQGKAEIKPDFVQNERTALRQADGRFLSRSIYAFPANDLDGKGRVTLLVRNSDDKEVARFVVDLSAMR